jgi:chorismate synthase
LSLSPEDIRRELRRRRPGGGSTGLGASTSRAEADEPEILSGVYGGKTLGTPIAILVRNTAQRSADYDGLKDLYRPGHADWTWEAKYGIRDHRGGGRSSGRETLGRVAAGAVAKVFLGAYGVTIHAWTAEAAGIGAPPPGDPSFDLEEAERNPLRFPSRNGLEELLGIIETLRKEGESAGGVAACRVKGLPPGLGEPVFGKLDARLGAAILSIGAVKGIEFGTGFAAAAERGSAHNDRPVPLSAARGDCSLRNNPVPLPPGVPALGYGTNRAGGVLGGISTGMPLEFRAAFKPVPSIAKPQQTMDREGTLRELIIKGRHDVCVVPRAVPVVEAMTALVLADLLLLARRDR